ncbi:hypothetical protein QAD02_006136 [Eretmocerus hayati]|uniref:Uncharacterized protein n=1 Tax=Eretmocerus hayati TaxID=131215 RepID=A0ACC2N2F9_9HYME|nr:hypothetical protein QAD02_006136 [Eretmocerus hayati]
MKCVESAALTASKENDLKTMQILIDTGFDLNERIAQCSSTTCLHEAVKIGHAKMVGFLLDSGANIGCIDGYNHRRGPLHVAIQIVNRKKRWKMVKLLMKSEASLSEKEHMYRGVLYNTTCLHEAVRSNDLLMVQYFLDAVAEVNCFNNGFYAVLEKVERDTPLQVALTLEGQARYKIVKMLLAAGANIGLCHNGYTCLHTAVAQKECSWELIKMLLDAGAELNCLCRLNISPLALAAKWNHVKIVEKMIEAGANINISNCCSNSALQLAISNQRKNIVNLLLKKGADVNARDIDGKNMLYCALKEAITGYRWRYRFEKVEILKVLLNSGAKIINPKSGEYNSYKILLKEQGDFEVFHLFTKSDGFQLKNCGVPFPLHLASQLFEPRILLYLLESHLYDVDEFDNDGWTALSLAACIECLIPNVRLLLEWGANVNIACGRSDSLPSDSIGRTALKVAFSKSNSEVGRLLIAAGSTIDLSVEIQDIPTIDCFIEYVVLLKSQGHFVNPANEKCFMAPRYAKFMKQCKAELKELKNISFDSYTNLYDLLLRKSIIHCVNNPSVRENFESINVVERFPHYGQQIKGYYSLSLVRYQVIENAMNGLHKIFRFRIDEIFFNLMAQLSMKDLRNLCII